MRLAGGEFSFQLAGTRHVMYLIQASTNLTTWQAIATNVLPASGMSQITDANAAGLSRRYYRAMKL